MFVLISSEVVPYKISRYIFQNSQNIVPKQNSLRVPSEDLNGVFFFSTGNASVVIPNILQENSIKFLGGLQQKFKKRSRDFGCISFQNPLVMFSKISPCVFPRFISVCFTVIFFSSFQGFLQDALLRFMLWVLLEFVLIFPREILRVIFEDSDGALS